MTQPATGPGVARNAGLSPRASLGATARGHDDESPSSENRRPVQGRDRWRGGLVETLCPRGYSVKAGGGNQATTDQS